MIFSESFKKQLSLKAAFALLAQLYSLSVIGLSFIIFVVPISIIALPFSVKIRIKIVGPFWKLFAKCSLHLASFTRITKIDLRDKKIKKQICPKGLHIANHLSFVDIPLLITAFQIPPIMKKEVLYIPFLGICGYAAGSIIVDRKSKDSRKKVLEKAKERLSSGLKSLQYYPEGTRQKNLAAPKKLEEIKKPLLEYAFENNIAVYPISIYGTHKVLGNDGKINYFQHIGVKHHLSISPSDFNSSDEFIRLAWSLVHSGHHELREKINSD